MSEIRVDQFCNLSTNPGWLSWLWRFSPALYQELATHLQTSRGCNHNRDKMVELMGKLQQLPEGRQQLLQFLRSNFPHMVVEPAVPPPFQEYDPELLTFPRRMILQESNQPLLRQRLQQFLADKPVHDSVIVGGRAFVEYVPAAYAAFAPQIPAKNWIIAQWRQQYPGGGDG